MEDIVGKTIDLKAKDGFTLAAYRADPAGKPKGGLVVIQEIFGVNHHIRNVADRFAAQGYTVPFTAQKLHRSPRTIKRQRQDICKLMGADNIAHAIALAFHRNLITWPQSTIDSK